MPLPYWRSEPTLARPTTPFAGNGRIAPRALDFVARFPSCSPDMTKQSFFAKRGDTFIPNPVSNGPWDPNSMHGRVVIGLLAHVIEEHHGSDEFVPARLTVDMFRLPNIQTPVEVTTGLVRDGKRIKVVEAEVLSGGTSIARASCQLLRRTGKCTRQRLVAIELGRAVAGHDPGADRPPARHERQMDDATHRRRDGFARPAAAVDERGP